MVKIRKLPTLATGWWETGRKWRKKQFRSCAGKPKC